jgi:hypothetical protein
MEIDNNTTPTTRIFSMDYPFLMEARPAQRQGC